MVGSNTFADVLLIQNSGALRQYSGGLYYATGYIGYEFSSSNNSVLVTDPGSVWSSYYLFVGEESAGNSLVINKGGEVLDMGGGSIGQGSGSSSNSVLVTDPGSVWRIAHGGLLTVGSSGAGNSLVINNGGQVLSDSSCSLGGSFSSSNNSVLVTDPGSIWMNDGLEVGRSGAGNSLVINNGGQVWSYSRCSLGYEVSSSNNSVLVTGTGSVWNSYYLFVGYDGGGNSLVISNGGQVVGGWSQVGRFGGSSSNSVLVTPTPARSGATTACSSASMARATAW